MKYLSLSALLLAFGLGIAACDSGEEENAGGDPSQITDTKWAVTEVTGDPVIDESRASFTFTASGGYGGNASCNSLSGRAEFEGSKVTISPGAMTKMACMEPVMAQENAVVKALEETESWALEEEELVFYDADGTPVLRFVPATSDMN